MTIIQEQPQNQYPKVSNVQPNFVETDQETLIKEKNELSQRIKEQAKDIDFFAKLTIFLLLIFIIIIINSFIIPSFSKKDETISTDEDFYKILNLHPESSHGEIMHAYREEWFKFRPESDVHYHTTSRNKFVKILEKYGELMAKTNSRFDHQKEPSNEEAKFFNFFNISSIIIAIFIVHLINRFFINLY